MKGKISLSEFIKDVKEDLKKAVDEDDPFFFLDEVELEVAFVLDAKAKAGGKFIVVDVGGETKASQTHKVKIKLTPFVEGEEIITRPTTIKKPTTKKNSMRRKRDAAKKKPT